MLDAYHLADRQLKELWDEPVFQNQIAATIARFFGLDYSSRRPAAGKPIDGAWSLPGR